MAISRSLMNRQLQADGGIMQVAPREKFGLGSKLKKFVRKIIPNEISEIAVKAAPFVAPFNPLLAAGMSGLGSFDQTGRIGSSLKSGALTYGMGQLARGIGGGTQNLQKGFNPFGGYDASAGLTRGLLTNPISDQGGLGKLFSNRGVENVKGVGDNTKLKTSTFNQDLTQDLLGDTVSSVDLISDSGSTFSNFVDYGTDLLKKGAKAAFTKADGSIDKAAVIGVATAAASYAEALMLARNAGVELTEEEYDQAQRDEKQAEYGEYLQNFFGGKKDGGRIGFESGANEMIKTQLLEEIMPETTTEDFIIIMTEDGPVRVKKSDYESMPGMFMDTTTSGYGDAGRGREVPPFADAFADGGRTGYAFGSEPKDAEVGIMTIDVEAGDDEDMEDIDMDMAMAFPTTVFSSSEITRLFRDRSLTTNLDRQRLFKVLMNPGMFPEGEKMLIRNLRGKADGGRIGYAKGANRVSELLITRAGILAQDPDADVSDIDGEIFQLTGKVFQSVGGISNIPTGNMRKNNAGVVERDYRDEGGFVPVGIKERADDVPAMLSKNEFVMTADAVRGIGNGSVEEGSKKLYNTMKKAEKVGKA